jgi:hypothetical protein
MIRTKIYLANFEQWEHYDAQKVASTVEESFRESYSVFLAAKGAQRAGEDSNHFKYYYYN